MKLECNPDSFIADPEGHQLAAAINQHLPPEVMYTLSPFGTQQLVECSGWQELPELTLLTHMHATELRARLQ